MEACFPLPQGTFVFCSGVVHVVVLGWLSSSILELEPCWSVILSPISVGACFPVQLQGSGSCLLFSLLETAPAPCSLYHNSSDDQFPAGWTPHHPKSSDILYMLERSNTLDLGGGPVSTYLGTIPLVHNSDLAGLCVGYW